MRLIDADELLNIIERSYLTKAEKRLFSIKVRHAPTVNKCDNCDLMFLEKTRGNGKLEYKGV